MPGQEQMFKLGQEPTMTPLTLPSQALCVELLSSGERAPEQLR